MEPQPPIATAPTPVLPLATPKPKNNNFLIVLLSVLLLLATSLAGFFAIQNQKLVKQLAQLQVQATPAPIASQAPNGNLANWKTYTNTKHGYSIKYPDGIGIKILFPYKGDVSQNTLVISFPEKDKWTSQMFIKYNAGNLKPSISQIKDGSKEVAINSTSAYQKIVFAIDSYKLTTYFVKNDSVIEIWYDSQNPNDPNLEEHKNIFDQILSTFRFTK